MAHPSRYLMGKVPGHPLGAGNAYMSQHLDRGLAGLRPPESLIDLDHPTHLVTDPLGLEAGQRMPDDLFPPVGEEL